MTRRAHRDPRSLLELRRLAYMAPRDPAARHVLQDALLETVPTVLEQYIERARKEDKRSGLEQLVWFRPKRMYHYTPEKRAEASEVTVESSPFPPDYDDPETSPPWSYRGEPFKRWVYQVLLDDGRAGRFPRTVQEAIEAAEGAGFEVAVKYNSPETQGRKRWNPVTWFFVGTNQAGSSLRTIDIERAEKKPSGRPGTVGESTHRQGLVIVYRTRGAL